MLRTCYRWLTTLRLYRRAWREAGKEPIPHG